MTILLLGSAGLLGSTLGPFLSSCGYDVKTQSRGKGAQYQADLIDAAETYELLDAVAPDSILNLAGLTNVDLCEAEPNQAFLANVRTVENVTSWVRNRNMPCHLVHISSDQVYDSAKLHSEENVTLRNYYAFSKYAGELAAASVPSTILRTNFLGRSHCTRRESLTDWIVRSLAKDEAFQVFEDIQFSPITMSTLSKMIELSIQAKPLGVFNLGSHNGMSKADFAFALADKLKLPINGMARTTTDRVKFLRAYRPKDMRMNSTKFEKALGVTLPQLSEEISRVAEEYLENC